LDKRATPKIPDSGPHALRLPKNQANCAHFCYQLMAEILMQQGLQRDFIEYQLLRFRAPDPRVDAPPRKKP